MGARLSGRLGVTAETEIYAMREGVVAGRLVMWIAEDDTNRILIRIN
jgi:hypothetical protein